MLRTLLMLLALAACKKAPPPPAPSAQAAQGAVPAAKPSVDIYVDGARTKTFQIADLANAKPLRTLVDGPVRSVLVHGDKEAWFPASELEQMTLSLNRRGEIIKVGLKEGGIRAVTRIEFRTPSSARLAGEP